MRLLTDIQNGENCYALGGKILGAGGGGFMAFLVEPSKKSLLRLLWLR